MHKLHERGPAEPADSANRATTVEVADSDVAIERADLGEGVYTQVLAGERIPAELAGLPRRPLDPPSATPNIVTVTPPGPGPVAVTVEDARSVSEPLTAPDVAADGSPAPKTKAK